MPSFRCRNHHSWVSTEGVCPQCEGVGFPEGEATVGPNDLVMPQVPDPTYRQEPAPIGEATPGPEASAIPPDQATIDSLPPNTDPRMTQALFQGTERGSLSPSPSRGGPKLPQAVPGYEILGTLGQGAMGVVYKAKQTRLNRVVALKMILSGGRASERDLERFLAEAQAVAKMQHPNILQIYEVGDQDGCPYFSLEFLDGGTLQEKLAQNPMAPRSAAQMVEVLARALQYAHEKGIVHRDIKPANILLAGDGTPKIADFGLAKPVDGDESSTPNTIVGTPVYMPPEQAMGKPDIGPAADIYSLGATLYEMLVGRGPFRGSSIVDTLRQVREAEPVPPRQLQPNVPWDLQTVCLKCLEKDPAKRYATAFAFAEDLRNFLDNKPIQARRATLGEKAWKWSRRHPAAAGLIAVSALGLIVLGLGGLAVASREHSLRRDADEQRDLAVKRGKEAQEQRDRALDQERIAKERGQEALQNFQRAQQAVEVLVRLAQQRLTSERHLDTVGKELLEKALVFYDQFLLQNPTDPVMKFQVARAHWLAGDLREKLARYDQAQQAYQTASGMYQKLIADHPDQAEKYRQDLAGVLINQATVLEVLKRPQDADAAFDKALDLLDQAPLTKTADATSEWLVAAGCNNRGVLLHQRRLWDEAEKAYLKGIDLFGKLAEKNPREPSFILEGAKTQANLAYLWTDPPPGKPEKAEVFYRKAIEQLGPLVQKNTEVPSYRKELGRVHLNRGVLYANQKQFAEARKDCQQAIDLFEELSRSYPGVEDYRQLSATGHANLGDLFQKEGRFPEAIDALTKSRQLLEKLAKTEAGGAGYRADFAASTAALAQAIEQDLRTKTKNGSDFNVANIDVEAASAERYYEEAFQIWKKLKDPRFGLQMTASYENRCEFHKFAAGLFRKQNPALAEHHLESRAGLRKEMSLLVPDSVELKSQRAEAILTLALLRAEMKKHVEAANNVDELGKVAPPGWPLQHLRAVILAKCLPATDDPKQTQRYGDQAMDILEKAVADGWNDKTFLGKHPLLEPLRSHPDWKDRYAALVSVK